MNVWVILKIIAAIATAATGLLALIKPSAAYGFIGLTANGVRGVSEIRAIFGGLFIALGIVPLFLGYTGIFNAWHWLPGDCSSPGFLHHFR